VSSILPFIAIHTEVTCSAAFAYPKEISEHPECEKRKLTTMGNNMRPMNGFGILYRSAVSSIDATTVDIKILNFAPVKRESKTDDSRRKKML